MAWATPDVPPELLAALGRQPQPDDAGIDPGPGVVPMPGAWRQPAMGMPPTGTGAAPTDPAAMLRSAMTPIPAAPAPSDDPAIAGQEEQPPAPPNLSNSRVAGLLGDYQKAQAGYAAVPRPDPNQLKPKLWERLAGFGLGTMAGMHGDGQAAHDVSAAVTGRRLNSADLRYSRATAPFEKSMQESREALPMAEAESKIPETDYQNKMEGFRARQQAKLQKSHGAQFEERAKLIGENFLHGTERRDPKSKTGWVAQTVNGETKEFTPPDLTKFHKPPAEPKNSEEAYSAASAQDDPAEKKRLNSLGDMLYKKETDKERIAHPWEHNKPATKGQFQGVENKRNQAWQKAHSEYARATKGLDPANATDKQAMEDARQDYYNQRQEAQDEYESGITNLGGESEHVDLDRNHFGEGGKPASAKAAAPAAAPAPAAARPAPTAPAAPAAAGPKKTASMSDIDAYVAKYKDKGVTREKAIAFFQKHGYEIAGGGGGGK